MNKKIDKILDKFLKSKKVGVFCDDANLYHGHKRSGWRVDFKRLKKFLNQYCELCMINYHVAVPELNDLTRKKTDDFLSKLNKTVMIKQKELKYIPGKNGFIKKGDVDINIAIDVIRNIDELDLVIILSGDSDYLELKNYIVKDKNKEIVFMSYRNNIAWELKQYCNFILLDKIKDNIVLNNKPSSTIIH